MKPSRLCRHLAASLVAAAPAGGFLFGTFDPGDPDPNPVGRIVYSCLMVVQALVYAGFPPRDGGAGTGECFNVWPQMMVACLLFFSGFIHRDRRWSRRSPRI